MIKPVSWKQSKAKFHEMIVLDIEVSAQAVRLAGLLILRCADRDSGAAIRKRETLATHLDCSEKSIKRRTDELVEAGYYKAKTRPGPNAVVEFLPQIEGLIPDNIVQFDRKSGQPCPKTQTTRSQNPDRSVRPYKEAPTYTPSITPVSYTHLTLPTKA